MLPPDELTRKWTKVLDGRLYLYVNDCGGCCYFMLDVGTQGRVFVRYHQILCGVPDVCILIKTIVQDETTVS